MRSTSLCSQLFQTSRRLQQHWGEWVEGYPAVTVQLMCVDSADVIYSLFSATTVLTNAHWHATDNAALFLLQVSTRTSPRLTRFNCRHPLKLHIPPSRCFGLFCSKGDVGGVRELQLIETATRCSCENFKGHLEILEILRASFFSARCEVGVRCCSCILQLVRSVCLIELLLGWWDQFKSISSYAMQKYIKRNYDLLSCFVHQWIQTGPPCKFYLRQPQGA